MPRNLGVTTVAVVLGVLIAIVTRVTSDDITNAQPLLQCDGTVSSDIAELSKRGLALFKAQRFNESIRCWERLVALEPTSGVAWNNMAHCYYTMNHTEQAYELYTKAAQVGTNAEPWANLGYLLFQNKRYADAARAFQRAAEREPSNLQHLTNAAVCHMELLEYDAALDLLHQVLEVNPDFPPAVSNTATIYRIKLISVADAHPKDLAQRRESDRDRRRRFEFIYHSQLWNMNDTTDPQHKNDPNTPRSGYGSNPVWARWARHALEDVIHDFGIRSVLDAPCGDMAWAQDVDLQGASYLGVDIVEPLIRANRERMRHRPELQFGVMDIVRDVPPPVDLIFCRETLQHLTQGDALRALMNFNVSGARYLMTTTFLEVDDNAIRFDVAAGFYPINLLRPPFNLPQPLRLYIDNTSTREYLGVWELPLWM